MNKDVLILAVGVFIGGIVFMLLEGLVLYGFEVSSRVNLPSLGLLSLLGVHGFGSLCTGIVIGNLTRENAQKLSFIGALIFTAMTLITVLIEVYPTWFVLCDVLIFTPLALLGSSLNFWGNSQPKVNSDKSENPEL